LDQAAKDLRERLPGWLSKAPDMPGLLHDYLKQATTGQLTSRLASTDLAQLRTDLSRSHQRSQKTVAAAAVLFSGAILLGLEAGRWQWFGFSTLGLLVFVLGGWMLLRAR
jgi:ubiquinone biosynthesis protein